MGWIGDVIDIGGDVLDYFAGEEQKDAIKDQSDAQAAEAKRVAEANAELSRYDATVTRLTALNIRNRTERNKELYYQNLNRLISRQRSGFANRGVVVGKGTPLDVRVESARAMTRDAEIMVNNGNTAMEQALSLARRFDMAAESGIREAAGAAYLIEKQADNAVNNVRWNQIGGAVESVYDIGSRNDWWS